jgi:hypothetical protein
MQEQPAYYSNVLHSTLLEALEEQYEVEISSGNYTYSGVIEDFDEAWIRINYYNTNSEPGNIKHVTAIIQRIIRLSDVTAIVFNVTETNLNDCLGIDDGEDNSGDSLVLA